MTSPSVQFDNEPLGTFILIELLLSFRWQSIMVVMFVYTLNRWAVLDSNQRPLRCQRNALTS